MVYIEVRITLGVVMGQIVLPTHYPIIGCDEPMG